MPEGVFAPFHGIRMSPTLHCTVFASTVSGAQAPSYQFVTVVPYTHTLIRGTGAPPDGPHEGPHDAPPAPGQEEGRRSLERTPKAQATTSFRLIKWRNQRKTKTQSGAPFSPVPLSSP